MSPRRPPPTRHALHRLEREIETARTAVEVLDQRRTRLVGLALGLIDRWKDQEADLEAAFAEAEAVRNQAVEREGLVALRSAARARSDRAELLFLTQEIQGVPVPLILSRGISKRLGDRGYGIVGTSAAMDETAAAHERVLELVVRQAELGTALRAFLGEIRRTSIRYHAIDRKLLPELEAQRAGIVLHLAEREREERLIQAFAKRKREASREAKLEAGRDTAHEAGRDATHETGRDATRDGSGSTDRSAGGDETG